MDSMEIINAIMTKDGITGAELGRRVDKSTANLFNIMKAGNPHIGTYLDIVKALGYKVVVTKDEVNGYEIGGEAEYIDGKEQSSIWKEIESLKWRLAEVESIVK